MTSPYLYALAERLHGQLGWLGLAVLLHPVISLRSPISSRGARLSAVLALLLTALPYAIGLAIYPTYREQVKPGLAQASGGWALAFELKEHLAFFTISLVLGGTVVLLTGQRQPARALLAMGWLCGVMVGVLGLLIAGRAHPAW